LSYKNVNSGNDPAGTPLIIDKSGIIRKFVNENN
jgi:hypothetical protein